MSEGDTRKILGISVIFILIGVAVGLSAGFLTWGSPRPQPLPKITIAIQPTEAASEIALRAQELEQYLESRVDADVEIYIPTTYAAVVEAIRFGNADVAFMSAWPTYIANKLAGAEIELAEVREVIIDQEKREETFYFSYWVVLKESPYSSLNELRGRKACFSSPISTSGYIFPTGKLVEEGFISKPEKGAADPKAFFREVVFGGGYGQCWVALKAGQVDVTIIAGDVSEKLYREVMENTRVLEKQGPVPSHGVVFSKSLADPLKSQLKDAFLELGKAEYRDLMRKFLSGTFVGFKPTTTAEHLAGLKSALELTGVKFSETLG